MALDEGREEVGNGCAARGSHQSDGPAQRRAVIATFGSMRAEGTVPASPASLASAASPASPASSDGVRAPTVADPRSSHGRDVNAVLTQGG